jgi:DNA repair protein RadC
MTERDTKYHLRTVTWRFRETMEELPALKHKQAVIIHSPDDLFRYYVDLFKDQVRERFVVFWLDAANRMLGFEVVTEGTLNTSLVHPREVFRGAIVATAAAIIVAHNHPSGNPEFSAEDVLMTKQLVESGKTIGIPVHDHIIFAGVTYTSMAERGAL